MYSVQGYHALFRRSLVNDIVLLLFSIFTGGLAGGAISVLSEILGAYINNEKLNRLLDNLEQALSNSLSGPFSLSDFSLEIHPDMKTQGLDLIEYIRVNYEGPLHPITFLFFLLDTAYANLQSGHLTDEEYEKVLQLSLLLLPAFHSVHRNKTLVLPVDIHLKDSILIRCGKGPTCRIARMRCNLFWAMSHFLPYVQSTLNRIGPIGAEGTYTIPNDMTAHDLQISTESEDITCERYGPYRKAWARYTAQGTIKGNLILSYHLQTPDELPFFLSGYMTFTNILIQNRKRIEVTDGFGYYRTYKELSIFQSILPYSNEETPPRNPIKPRKPIKVPDIIDDPVTTPKKTIWKEFIGWLLLIIGVIGTALGGE